MKRLLFALAAAMLVSLPRPAAAAAITLTLEPQVVAFNAGEIVDVDVVVGNLGEFMPPSVGAFDLTVAFDDSVLLPLDVDFGLLLGDPSLFEAIAGFDASAAGLVEFAEVSLLSPDDLDALQPASFRLATLQFLALADGRGAFAFVGDLRVDDPFGIKFDVIGEPPAAALALLAAALALGVRRRYRR